MSERKYTDEQIVKALECCQSHTITDCRDCPNRASGDNCVNELMRNALDLIKRQKAEIAVLTTAVDNSTKEFLKLHDEYQDQKEEIERLQEYYKLYFDRKSEIKELQETIEHLQGKLDLCAEENERLADRSHKCIYLSDEESMEYCVDGPCPHYEAKAKAKAEAIKEFAERVKEERGIAYPFTSWVHISDIDLLVAEMTEGE